MKSISQTLTCSIRGHSLLLLTEVATGITFARRLLLFASNMPLVNCRRATCILRPSSISASTTSTLSPCILSSKSQTRHASTRSSRLTIQRRLMWSWLNGPGSVFREPRQGSTNYLGAYDRYGNLIRGSDQTGDEGKKSGNATDKKSAEPAEETEEDLRPFPLNPYFRSQSVLSEELKDEIYTRVVVQGKTIRAVSQMLNVEMRRIAAVVRLKTVEQQWTKQSKPLAKTYARAITAMLPTTPYSSDPSAGIVRHESINDLPVHAATQPQIFHPVPESRKFTRVDAGKVFQRDLLPADDRIPHPDLIKSARDFTNGIPQAARKQRQNQRLEADDALQKKKKLAQERQDKWGRKVVAGKRWDFVFREMDSEANAGKNGRNAPVGWRYGFPLEDRKKGMVKIPTSVE